MNPAKFRKDYYNTIFYCRILHLYFKWPTKARVGKTAQKNTPSGFRFNQTVHMR
ncbi:hypothetical protein TGS27_2393 [Geobacillus stearothermophilus]|nr:hypothetical protein TGS27_2393 [Geobacillus stearothermophilus]